MLEQINVKKAYLNKSEMTSGNKYRVTINYKGKTIWFVFHDNIYNKSGKIDFISCLLQDAWGYDDNRDIYEFAENFGYDYYADLPKVKKAYYGCKRQYQRVNKLFTEAEQELLQTELEALGY